MDLIVILALIVLAILVLMQFFKQQRMPKNTVVGFVGTMGSGKTYLAVREALRAYRRQRLKYRLRFLPFFSYFFPECHRPPAMYSNIPIKIGFRKFAQVFRKEHLMRRKALPEGAILVLDEIGQLASQWDYDNPYVREQLADLTRFYRHWIDGRMFVTDQSSENIVKPLRCRLGVIYHLNDFRRWLAFTPFFKVHVKPLLMVEDDQKDIEEVTEEGSPFFFGLLHYKWLSKLLRLYRYNTRCYKPIYSEGASTVPVPYEKSLYTRYLIDISVSKNEAKDYKDNRAKYRAALYRPSPFSEGARGKAEPPPHPSEKDS